MSIDSLKQVVYECLEKYNVDCDIYVKEYEHFEGHSLLLMCKDCTDRRLH